jgi:hypothetical protein
MLSRCFGHRHRRWGTVVLMEGQPPKRFANGASPSGSVRPAVGAGRVKEASQASQSSSAALVLIQCFLKMIFTENFLRGAGGVDPPVCGAIPEDHCQAPSEPARSWRLSASALSTACPIHAHTHSPATGGEMMRHRRWAALANNTYPKSHPGGTDAET